jgi:hypothetical protein
MNTEGQQQQQQQQQNNNNDKVSERLEWNTRSKFCSKRKTFFS